jgi:hypothetical protein
MLSSPWETQPGFMYAAPERGFRRLILQDDGVRTSGRVPATAPKVSGLGGHIRALEWNPGDRNPVD